MKRTSGSWSALTWIAAACIAVAPALAFGDTAVAVTSGGALITFDTNAPGTVQRTVTITGLQPSETILGVDFRPKDGRLYALGSTSRLYVIDVKTGVAAQVAGTGPFSPALSGTDFGFDFDPVRDQIRVVSDADQNLRLDPTTGLVLDGDPVTAGIQPDDPLEYRLGDVNVAANPNVVALANDRDVTGAAATTVFGIDSGTDTLVRIGDVDGTPDVPDNGLVNTVGPLGVNASGLTSFDIANGRAFAAITLPSATTTGLYTVNLTTGTATVVGTIGGGATIRAMAVEPVRFLGLTADDELVAFTATNPGATPTPTTITGLQANEHVVAIARRPSTGRLYGVGDSGRLYRIDETTGAATQVGTGTFAVAPTGTTFSADFDPTTDRLRLVSDADQNLRINADTGQVVDGDAATAGVQPDANLAFVASDVNTGVNPDVVAIAYDTDAAGAASATLYGIDAGLDALVRVGSVAGVPDSASTGKLVTVGPLGVNVTGSGFFDVVGGPQSAYAVLTPSGAASSSLYSINLTTGAATRVGTVGGKTIRSAVVTPDILPPAPASVDMIALIAPNSLVTFNSANPGALSAPLPITGLASGENLVAIDVRPATGVLYGVSDQNHLYSINFSSGEALAVSSTAFTPSLSGTNFGFDFDPHGDVARVVSDSDQNLRIDPTTGTVKDSDTVAAGTQPDANLAFDAADRNAGANPNVVALAYDRNSAGAAATTLFGIDSGLDVLVRQGSVDGTPNSADSGKLTTIGALGVDATGLTSFEITPSGAALAAVAAVSGPSRLYQIDLTTGAASLIGEVGDGTQVVRGLSIVPTAQPSLPLDVTALTIGLSFCGFGKDSVSMTGTLPAGNGSFEGKTVAVDVGGLSKTFTLDKKGRGVSGDDTFQLVGRPKNGNVTFKLTIKKEHAIAIFRADGLTGGEDGDLDLKNADRQVVVRITFDGTTYQSTIALLYTTKAGHSGLAKKKPPAKSKKH